ncbi:hypothetical protein REPUB_Repub06bG0092200 [Reevesia pubescens]
MIGVVEKVETWGEKPLRLCSMLSLPNSEKIMVTFKYERLPDLCYICGCLDHLESDCHTSVIMKKELGVVKREYGFWLRAKIHHTWGLHAEFSKTDSMMQNCSKDSFRSITPVGRGGASCYSKSSVKAFDCVSESKWRFLVGDVRISRVNLNKIGKIQFWKEVHKAGF